LDAVWPRRTDEPQYTASKAGSFALDGDGANSPHVLTLLNHLPTPGFDLRIAFDRVHGEVLNETRNKQEPFVYGSLGGGTVSIVDALWATPYTVPSPVLTGPIGRAERAWAVIPNTTSIAVFEDFIRQFGNTPYGSMARARVLELKKGTVAPAVGPPPQLLENG
jgi:hypothetical protein